jgi:hypothetical protein
MRGKNYAAAIKGKSKLRVVFAVSLYRQAQN